MCCPQAQVREVCRLWHELAVPLKTRARFWMGFRGREDHYWATEHRRLTFNATRLNTKPSQQQSPRTKAVVLQAVRAQARAERALKVSILVLHPGL